MEMRRLGGENGFDLSVVGLGCNAFGRRLIEADSTPVIHAALDAGINFFDTAEIYGDGLSEEFVGRAIGGRRDEIRIATKFGLRKNHARNGGSGSRENIRIAIELSLKRLGTDIIDLYQIHMPDPSTPIAETLGAMNELVTEGKVRLIGCSNFSADQLREAASAAKEMGLKSFVTAQNEWSLLDRDIEAGLIPACVETGAGILPFYPLARGLLTGKYRRDGGSPDGSRLAGELQGVDFDVLEALEGFAASRGFTLLTLAVSWLASQEVTASVICGAAHADQPAQNAAAAAWNMNAEDLAEIDRILG
jgi:aryl-alcohol dehydrogenase-like predicted oxidoreductase